MNESIWIGCFLKNLQVISKWCLTQIHIESWKHELCKNKSVAVGFISYRNIEAASLFKKVARLFVTHNYAIRYDLN